MARPFVDEPGSRPVLARPGGLVGCCCHQTGTMSPLFPEAPCGATSPGGSRQQTLPAPGFGGSLRQAWAGWGGGARGQAPGAAPDPGTGDALWG